MIWVRARDWPGFGMLLVLVLLAAHLISGIDHVGDGKVFAAAQSGHGVTHGDTHSGGDDSDCTKSHGCHAADLAAFGSNLSFGIASALLLPGFVPAAKSFAERMELLATPPPR